MGRVTTRVPRVRIDSARGSATARPDTVIVEEPLEIRVNGGSITTTMRTPGDDFDLALGHLLTEGLLTDTEAIAGMMHCLDEDASGSPTFNVVDVALKKDAQLVGEVRRRTSAMTSACGVCGSESIADVATRSRFELAHDPIHLPAQVALELPSALRAQQPAFERTGGSHAAGLALADGELLAVREDVGRHNAVDKVIGAVARERPLPLSGTVLVVSARASFEILQKAAMVGIPVVVAVGAPTSLAVDLATQLGMTLLAMTRHPTVNVFGRTNRVQSPRPPQ